MAKKGNADEKPNYDEEFFQFISKSEYDSLIRTGFSLDQMKALEEMKRVDALNINHTDYPYIAEDDFERLKKSGTFWKEHFEKENLIQKERTEKIIRRLTMDQHTTLKPTETEELRIALIGKTGNGKSATANTLFSEEKTETFTTGLGNNSVTTVISPATTYVCGTRVVIVDTPGLFDTRENFTNEHTLKEIAKLITLLSEGIHAFLYVSNVSSRLTAEENEVFNLLNEHFGDSFQRHCILVYTHADDIIKEKDKRNRPLTLQQCTEEVAQSDDVMKAFFEELEGRIIAIDNSSTLKPVRRRNREAILALVQQVSNNGKRVYSNDLFKKAQELKKGARTSQLAEVIGNHIEETLKRDPSFISEIDRQNVSEEFIREIESQVQNNYFASAEIELSIRMYMKVNKQAIEEIFNEVGNFFQKCKRQCIIL